MKGSVKKTDFWNRFSTFFTIAIRLKGGRRDEYVCEGLQVGMGQPP
jgi:hypothetical protein